MICVMEDLYVEVTRDAGAAAGSARGGGGLC